MKFLPWVFKMNHETETRASKGLSLSHYGAESCNDYSFNHFGWRNTGDKNNFKSCSGYIKGMLSPPFVKTEQNVKHALETNSVLVSIFYFRKSTNILPVGGNSHCVLFFQVYGRSWIGFVIKITCEDYVFLLSFPPWKC